MQHPDTVIVRGKNFKLSETSKSPSYSGPVTDHVTGVVVLNPPHGWIASLVEKNPLRKDSSWTPAFGEATTPQAALELVFDKAAEIEARYGGVVEEREKGTAPPRSVSLTPEADEQMTQQSPKSRFNPKSWSVGTILIFLAIAAVFIAMLTWDRGHFEQKQPPGAQSQPK